MSRLVPTTIARSARQQQQQQQLTNKTQYLASAALHCVALLSAPGETVEESRAAAWQCLTQSIGWFTTLSSFLNER